MAKYQTKYYKIDPASNFGKLSLDIHSDYLIKPRVQGADHNGNNINPRSKLVNLSEQEDVAKNKDASACMDLDETKTVDEETCSQLSTDCKEDQAEAQLDYNAVNSKHEIDDKKEIVDEEDGEHKNHNHNDENQDQDGKEYEELFNKSHLKCGIRYSDAFKLKIVQYSLNHTQRQTAAKFGVSNSMVSKWSRKAETFIHSGQSDKESSGRFKISLSERDKALNYSITHSVQSAAEKFGVPLRTLYRMKRIRTTSHAIASEIVEELVEEAEGIMSRKIDKRRSCDGAGVRSMMANVEVVGEDLHAAAAVRPCYVKMKNVSYADSEIDTKSLVQISIKPSKPEEKNVKL